MSQMVTGITRGPDFFKFYESDRIEGDKVWDVLQNKMIGCIFHNVIPQDVCDRVTKNFWNNPFHYKRGDQAPAHYVGTFHFQKDLNAYFDELERTRLGIEKLFEGTENFFENFISKVTAAMQSNGIEFRVARHEGKEAGRCLMRSWSGDGTYALSPHDDLAQMFDPKQKGFEIQKTTQYTVLGVNMCVENGGGGELNIWDIQPDHETRKRLGIEFTGHPYPVEHLAPYPHIKLPIKSGDIYFFNGINIHGVAAQASKDVYRSTISQLIGQCDEKTVIYWT